MNKLMSLVKDERGAGAMFALAFALITTALLSTLASSIALNGVVSTAQRTTEAAEASVRGVVDSVLGDINRGLSPEEAVAANSAPPAFSSAGIEGRVTIEDAEISATAVNLTLRVTSTGRVPWKREGTAELELAQVVSLARLDEGRAVWDFAPTTGAEEVVALWTAGEMTVNLAGDKTTTIPAPAPAPITFTTVENTVNFTATHAGCLDGWTPEVQTRVQAGRTGIWSRYAVASAGTVKTQPGQQISLGARARCVNGEQRTGWAASETSLIVPIDAPAAPDVKVEMDADRAKVTVTSEEQPSSAIVSVQLRTRTGGGEWSDWTDVTGPVHADLPQGYQVEAQARIRVITDAGDSDWIESPVTSFTRPL